ncbi:MAG: LPS export ABC transporter permease LptF [Betaproteobacteria bacterium]|nr:LPS export ABC transporter permease LptF [Betaproteobacteria bacterium]
MTRFERALVREMVALTTLSSAALSAIYAVVILVRTLGKAAVGDIGVGDVLPMLGFALMRFLPVILSLACFIGVFMSLTRLWRDSESIIWMGGGIGPAGWIRPVLIFMAPMMLLISVVSMVLLPWATRTQAIFERAIHTGKDEVTSLSPGLFTETEQGNRVYFVERASADGLKVENVFVQAPLQGRMGVIVAHQGHVESHASGDRFLVLENGRRYDGIPGEADFRMAKYDAYAVRIPANTPGQLNEGPRSLYLNEILTDPTPVKMGELVWRVGHSLCALMLCLLAIPLSYVNPRAGKSLNVVFVILIYVAYNNLVGVSDDWVARSRLSAAGAIFLVHGAMAIFVAYLFWRRFSGPWAR